MIFAPSDHVVLIGNRSFIVPKKRHMRPIQINWTIPGTVRSKCSLVPKWAGTPKKTDKHRKGSAAIPPE